MMPLSSLLSGNLVQDRLPRLVLQQFPGQVGQALHPGRGIGDFAGRFLASAISSGRVETPSVGETAMNIGFSDTNPIGRKSFGTCKGTFGAAGCNDTKVDSTG